MLIEIPKAKELKSVCFGDLKPGEVFVFSGEELLTFYLKTDGAGALGEQIAVDLATGKEITPTPKLGVTRLPYAKLIPFSSQKGEL